LINLKKTKYSGGYLGYLNISNFGDVSILNMAGTETESKNIIYNLSCELENKISDYLSDIPDGITYSILPVLRSKHPNGEYKTVTIKKKIY